MYPLNSNSNETSITFFEKRFNKKFRSLGNKGGWSGGSYKSCFFLKLRAVAAAAGRLVCVGGRSRQAEAAGVDESLIAWGWCAVDFFAHVSGFLHDVVGCQKTGTLFSRHVE